MPDEDLIDVVARNFDFRPEGVVAELEGRSRSNASAAERIKAASHLFFPSLSLGVLL